jgi:hypothetical protein
MHFLFRRFFRGHSGYGKAVEARLLVRELLKIDGFVKSPSAALRDNPALLDKRIRISD